MRCSLLASPGDPFWGGPYSWLLGAPTLLLAQEHQIIGDHVAHMQVDDPVHQVEADEAHGEYDARVLVDIRWRDAQELVDVLMGDW